MTILHTLERGSNKLRKDVLGPFDSIHDFPIDQATCDELRWFKAVLINHLRSGWRFGKLMGGVLFEDREYHEMLTRIDAQIAFQAINEAINSDK